jgi:ABC-type transporter MlaC component
VIKRAGLVILVLVLSVISQGFGDKAAPGDGVAPIADPEIRPLAIVTSPVSRGPASLRSHRVELNTSEERRPEIRRAADELFDVDEIARRALGQHWKGLLPQEQHVAGTFAQVHSRISPERGSENTIEYRLSRSGSQWTVYDIVLDGASLVSNYRSQFNGIIGTSSVRRSSGC